MYRSAIFSLGNNADSTGQATPGLLVIWEPNGIVPLRWVVETRMNHERLRVSGVCWQREK
jgi:hypothetical protein